LGEGFAIRRLDVDEARAAVPGLADVLIDCVAGGASVSFMAPLELDKAVAFWNGVIEAVGRGERALVVAEAVGEGRIVGTVQVVLNQPENQPHRADISKLLVHREARGEGIAAALMDAAEDAARAAGKTLLVLDTAPAAMPSGFMRGWGGRWSAGCRIMRFGRMAGLATRPFIISGSLDKYDAQVVEIEVTAVRP
jgi:GNAT superfamily N-acetyltransferase